MPEKFIADTALQGERSRDSLHLNLTLVNAAGASQVVALSPTAVAELAELLKQHICDPRQGDITRIPTRFSVGHGRFERVVLLKFEDDIAYGLEPDLVEELVNALTDEVDEISERRMPLVQ